MDILDDVVGIAKAAVDRLSRKLARAKVGLCQSSESGLLGLFSGFRRRDYCSRGSLGMCQPPCCH